MKKKASRNKYQHSKKSHRIREYDSIEQCHLCLWKGSKILLKKHFFSVHKARRKPVLIRYKCNLCPFVTSTPTGHYYHALREHGKKITNIFYCELCGYATDSPPRHLRHCHSLHNLKKCQCIPIEGSKFIKFVEENMEVVEVENSDKAEVVVKQRSRKKAQPKKRVQVEEESPDPVDFDDWSNSPYKANNNEQATTTQPSTESSEIHECAQCSFSTRRFDDYTSHMAQHVTPDFTRTGPRFQCTECPYATEDSDLFKTHSAAHQVYKPSSEPIRCDVCMFHAASTEELMMHTMSSHGSLQPQTQIQPTKLALSSLGVLNGASALPATPMCPLCGLSIQSSSPATASSAFLKHLNSVHNIPTPARQMYFPMSPFLHQLLQQQHQLRNSVAVPGLTPGPATQESAWDLSVKTNDDAPIDLSSKKDSSPTSADSQQTASRPPERLYRCPHCDRRYRYIGDLNVHMKKSHNAAPFRPRKDGVDAKTMEKYIVPDYVPSTPGDVPRDPDTPGSSIMKALTQPSQVSGSVRSLVTPQLTARPRTTINIPSHRTDPQPLTCGICRFTTKLRTEYEQHLLKVHRELRPYRCRYCGYRTRWKTDVKRHCRFKHKDQNENNAVVEELHMLSDVLTDAQTPLLPLAPRPQNSVNSPESMEGVVNGAENEKTMFAEPSNSSDNAVGNVQCHICSYKAESPSKLGHHLKAHRNERPWRCSECGKDSNWKWDITKHIKVAHPNSDAEVYEVNTGVHHAPEAGCSDEPPHKQPRVERAVPNTSAKNLIGLLSQRRLKPYRCSVCGHRSNWRGDVVKHLKFRHEGQGDVCVLSDQEARAALASWNGASAVSMAANPGQLLTLPDLSKLSDKKSKGGSNASTPVNSNTPMSQPSTPDATVATPVSTSKPKEVSGAISLMSQSASSGDELTIDSNASASPSPVSTEATPKTPPTGLNTSAQFQTSPGRGAERIHSCGMCPYITRSRNDWTYHKHFHSSERKDGVGFPCDECSYVAPLRRLLHQHQRVHAAGYRENRLQALAKSYREARNALTNSPASMVSMVNTGGILASTLMPTDLSKDLDGVIRSENTSTSHAAMTSPHKSDVSIDEEIDGSAESALIKHDIIAASIAKPSLEASADDQTDFKEVISELKQHKLTCEKCPYSTADPQQYEKHTACHGSRRRCTCSSCDYSVNSDSQLLEHQRLHARPHPNLLAIQPIAQLMALPTVEAKDVLEAKLATEELQCNNPIQLPLPDHRQMPENNDGGELTCAICPFVCKDQRTLQDHIKGHSSDAPGELTCERCGFRCSSQLDLCEHEQLHSRHRLVNDLEPGENGSLECQFCGRRLSSPGELARHEMQHASHQPTQAADSAAESGTRPVEDSSLQTKSD